MNLKKKFLSIALAGAITITSISLSSFIASASSSNANTKNIMAAQGTLANKHSFSILQTGDIFKTPVNYSNNIHNEEDFVNNYADDYTFFMMPSSSGTMSVTNSGITTISKDPTKNNYYTSSNLSNPYPDSKNQSWWDNSSMKYLPVIADNDDLVGGLKKTSVYKLPASKSGSYNLSCTYKKAGNYNGRDIDVKITISNWDVGNDWESEKGNNYTNRMPGGGDFGFLSFSKSKVGIYTAYLNWVQVDYAFTYSDTGATAKVKGHSTWKDVDYSQGITFKQSVVNNNKINLFRKEAAFNTLSFRETLIGSNYALSVYDETGNTSSLERRTNWITATFEGTGFSAIYSFCGHQENSLGGDLMFNVRSMPSGTIQNDSPVEQGTMSIKKLDSTSKDPLSGAVFELYQRKPNSSDFNKVSTATTKSDGTAYFLTSSGSNMWNILVSGEYQYRYAIKEVSAPDGYIMDSKGQNVTAPGEYVFTNQGIEGTIKLQKVDPETNQNLEGAVFAVFEYDKTTNKYNEDKAIISGETDVNGKLELTVQYSQNNQGKFKVKEIKNPRGYQGEWEQVLPQLKTNGQILTVEYTDPIPNESIDYNNIIVEKLDKDNGYKLTGAEFEILEYNVETKTYNHFCNLVYDEVSETYITTTPLHYHQKVNDGKFKVVETKAPDGYVLDGWEQEFNLLDYNSNEPIKFTCENPVKKGIININKTNKDTGEPLEGIEFDIIAARDIYLPQGQKIVSKGDVVDHLITDSDGKAQSKELYVDYADQTSTMYNVVETKTLTDYVFDETPHPVTFVYGDEAVSEITLDIKNDPMKPDSKVAKIADKTTGAEITNGRYTGTKVSGIYSENETVNFTITVTNSGNVPILNTVVQDRMSDELAAVVENAKFVTSGEVLTVGGNKANVTLNNDTAASIDRLEIGDSIQLMFQAKIKSGTAMKYLLDNTAVITSSEYNNNEEDKLYKPENPDNWKDNDKINIPGSPELRVAKLADKTTGSELENGRYKGKKKSGVYNAGEKVTYKITVSNTGNADALKVIVKDTMSKELKAVLDKDSITFTKLSGRIKSTNGNTIEITSKSNTKLVLDKLPAGDSVELTLTATVKSELSESASDLNNKVEVTGKYHDGNGNVPVPVTKLMVDDDDININVPIADVPEGSMPDTGTKALGGIAAGGFIIAAVYVIYSIYKRRKAIKG